MALGGMLAWPARCAVALRQGQPAALLDRLEAERAVAAAAGEDDADGALALVVGEAAEEQVDRVGRALGARPAHGARSCPCSSVSAASGGMM